METTEEQHGLLHQILPPRLEDAGLEDCALPPESIHQAFLKAASTVKSRAAAIFSDDDAAAGDCVSSPWPAEDASDALIWIEPENEPPGACAVEKGCDVEEAGDEVVVGEGAKLGEGEEPCVDELQGLGIEEDAKKKKNGDEEKEKEPTLAEGYV